MKALDYTFLIATICLCLSCNNKDIKGNTTKENAIVKVASDSLINQNITNDWRNLTNDFMTWYTYTNANIRLSQDFIGIDIDSQNIDKSVFLGNLMTGNVVAYKTKILEGIPVYQLFKLNSDDESIKSTSKQMAS